MEGFTIITISGEDSNINGDWYAPANQLQYVNDRLINISSSSIYLYKNSSSTYPRITLPSNQNPVYYGGSYNEQYAFSVEADQVQFNMNAQIFRMQPYWNIVICTLLLFLVFTRLIRRTKSW